MKRNTHASRSYADLPGDWAAPRIVDLGYPNVHWYRHCTEGCEEPPLSTQGGAAPLVPWSYLSISYLVLNLHEELWVLPKTCLRSALRSILRLVCIVESLRKQP